MPVWKRDTFLAIASIGSRKKIDLLTVEAQLAHSADTHAVCILETAFDIRAWHLRHRASLQRGERARASRGLGLSRLSHLFHSPCHHVSYRGVLISSLDMFRRFYQGPALLYFAEPCMTVAGTRS
jgi:hypothetical protein